MPKVEELDVNEDKKRIYCEQKIFKFLDKLEKKHPMAHVLSGLLHALAAAMMKFPDEINDAIIAEFQEELKKQKAIIKEDFDEKQEKEKEENDTSKC